MNGDFGVAFIAFLDAAQQKVADDYAAWSNNSIRSMGNGPKLDIMSGPRYIRIVSVQHDQRSAFAFIDKTNGDGQTCKSIILLVFIQPPGSGPSVRHIPKKEVNT